MMNIGIICWSLLGMASAPEPQEEPKAQVTVAEKWNELFEWSKSQTRGVTIVVNGHPIPGIVIEYGKDYVQVKNREHDMIVVRLDRIDAVLGK